MEGENRLVKNVLIEFKYKIESEVEKRKTEGREGKRMCRDGERIIFEMKRN